MWYISDICVVFTNLAIKQCVVMDEIRDTLVNIKTSMNLK